MYEIDGWYKFAEKDDWEKGCDPDMGISSSGNDRFSADTIDALLKKVLDFLGAPYTYHIDFDPMGDEDGRVDISFLETGEAYYATDAEIEQWKKGERDLWAACYVFHVEEVTRKPAKF